MARTTTPVIPPGKPILKHPRDKEKTAYAAAPATREQQEKAAAWIAAGVADGSLGPIDGWDPDDTLNGYFDILGLNNRPMASTKTTAVNERRIANLGL